MSSLVPRHSLFLAAATTAAAFAAPAVANADGPCAFEGDGAIEDVQPDGTELRFGLAGARTRVRLEGQAARIEAVEPIAFMGRAEADSVALTLGSVVTARGVLRVDVGVPVRVRRVANGRAAARVVAGPTAFMVGVGCEDLVYGERAEEPSSRREDSGLEGGSRRMLVRGNQLRVYSGAASERGLALRRLRSAPPGSEWPVLDVLEARNGRLRVRGELAPGVTLQGWVAREELLPLDPHRGRRGSGGTGGCGVLHAGSTTYRGPVTLEAGTALLDSDGRPWGRTTRTLDVSVVVTEIGRRGTTDGTVDAIELVWVERMPTIQGPECGSFGIRLRRSDVRFDERDDTRGDTRPLRAPARAAPAIQER